MLRISPSHLGRQLLGLALNAPETIQSPPSEGSRLHGLFDEEGKILCHGDVKTTEFVCMFPHKPLVISGFFPGVDGTGRASSMPAMCFLAANAIIMPYSLMFSCGKQGSSLPG